MNQPINRSINQPYTYIYICIIIVIITKFYLSYMLFCSAYIYNSPSSMIHGALGGSWCPCWPSSWSLWKSPKPCWRFSCCVAWGAGRTSSPGAVVATATDTGLAGGRCNVKRWGTRLRSNKKKLAGDWKTNFEGLWSFGDCRLILSIWKYRERIWNDDGHSTIVGK